MSEQEPKNDAGTPSESGDSPEKIPDTSLDLTDKLREQAQIISRVARWVWAEDKSDPYTRRIFSAQRRSALLLLKVPSVEMETLVGALKALGRHILICEPADLEGHLYRREALIYRIEIRDAALGRIANLGAPDLSDADRRRIRENFQDAEGLAGDLWPDPLIEPVAGPDWCVAFAEQLIPSPLLRLAEGVAGAWTPTYAIPSPELALLDTFLEVFDRDLVIDALFPKGPDYADYPPLKIANRELVRFLRAVKQSVAAVAASEDLRRSSKGATTDHASKSGPDSDEDAIAPVSEVTTEVTGAKPSPLHKIDEPPPLEASACAVTIRKDPTAHFQFDAPPDIKWKTPGQKRTLITLALLEGKPFQAEEFWSMMSGEKDDPKRARKKFDYHATNAGVKRYGNGQRPHKYDKLCFVLQGTTRDELHEYLETFLPPAIATARKTARLRESASAVPK